MAQVEVTVNGHSYRIACDDGQEEHLRQLAGYVDGRIKELVATVGQAGESRLLIMASLLIADELSDSVADLDIRSDAEAEARLAAATEALAERIESIAAGLEAA